MLNKRTLIGYWFPVIGWMLTIFILSSRERVAVSEEYILNFTFFKSLHVIEYGILGFLIFRLINHVSKKSLPRQKYIEAFLFALIYANTDELHQTFVPTRQGAIRDVLIDCIGISITLYFIYKNFKRLKKFGLL